MKKLAAIAALWLTASVASAHEDRILPIGPDGTLGGIPASYGPVKVKVSRDARHPAAITGVRVSSPRFTVTLSDCVVEKLKGIAHVEASGSWYHDQRTFPPYVSLVFYTGRHDPASPTNDYYSVTFSLLDGRILMGQRARDPLIGRWMGRVIDPADKCSHWRQLGV